MATKRHGVYLDEELLATLKLGPDESLSQRLNALMSEARPWHSLYDRRPPELERVECFAQGWASVAQGVMRSGQWTVWFGSELLHLAPSHWRPLPQRPMIG